MKKMPKILNTFFNHPSQSCLLDFIVRSYEKTVAYKKPAAKHGLVNAFVRLIAKYNVLYNDYLESLKSRFLFLKSSKSLNLEKTLNKMQQTIFEWVSIAV